MQLLAGSAVAFGLLLSLFNWASIFMSRPDKHVSPIPILGGVLLAVGFLGFEQTRPYWWLAGFLDFGSLMALLALPWFLSEWWSHRDSKAVHVFANREIDRAVVIRLFENGDAAINISFDPSKPIGDQGHLAVSCGFVGKWVSGDEQFTITGYAGGRKLVIWRVADRFILSETDPDDDEPSVYSIDGMEVERLPAKMDNRKSSN